MTDLQIAFGWNSYQSCASNNCTQVSIQENGILNWVDTNVIVSIFFYVAATGVFDLALVSSEIQRNAEILVSIPKFQRNFNLRFSANNLTEVQIGKVNITSPGYVKVNLQGTNSILNRLPGNYPALNTLILKGVKDTSKVTFVRQSFSSHYGRRGPSTHLNYNFDWVNNNITSFYNEVTVPKSYDAIGTYAMAIGFQFGYLGMQVNSENERRILFSVWSPQSTDNPDEIVEENKVINGGLGPNTQLNDFGGEGSGGQSYIVYPWVADVAYQFYLEGHPDENGYSSFTAYFKDPTKHTDFIYIATWKRPKTQSYLTEIYSFLENFDAEKGSIQRKAYFNNQSAINDKDDFIEIPSATFSYDETASQKQRLDYDGGYNQQTGFYLSNCGFIKTGARQGDLFRRQQN